MYESFLEKVALLAPLDKDQRNRMVDALEEVACAPTEKIIREGDEGTHFYIIVEGEVRNWRACECQPSLASPRSLAQWRRRSPSTAHCSLLIAHCSLLTLNVAAPPSLLLTTLTPPLLLLSSSSHRSASPRRAPTPS